MLKRLSHRGSSGETAPRGDGGDASFSSSVRIETLIARQIKRQPDSDVSVSDSGSMTFGEFDRLSNKLARRMRSLGVSAGTYVMVSLERDHSFLVALLAVMKIGAAFIPIEIPEASARIEGIAELPTVTWILTDTESVAAFKRTRLRTVMIDVVSLRESAEDDSPIFATGTSADPAYGIPTSGSTGLPKTVVVAHSPLVKLVEWIGSEFGIGPADRGLWISPASFDLSIFDLLGLPALGASVRMLSREARTNPILCADAVANDSITFWNSTPALLQSVLPFLRQARSNRSRHSLRLVFVSGDWVPLTLYDELREIFPNARLIALGGATEATIWSNYYPVTQVDPGWTSIPYGYPIPGARYYILDANHVACDENVRGELYIGGHCLALGYLGDETLTRTRFLPDPYSSVPGARIYRTGDAARFWPDGTIELLGRVDNQVNVSGYRIDLGEVESALRRAGLTNAAAVALPNVAGTKRVAAAGVPASADVTIPSVLDSLGRWLPAYMIPTQLLLLSRLPLTGNGKIDRKAIADLLLAPSTPSAAPVHARSAEPGPHVAPSDVDAFLRVEISSILGSHVHGFPDDQPLGELGLNSLAMAVLSGRVFEVLHIKISPVEFYAGGTLKSVVDRIARIHPTDFRIGKENTRYHADAEQIGVTEGVITVIGFSCRLPGAANISQFWDCLEGGKDCMRPLPESRARVAGVDSARSPPGGYLDQIDHFDARLFGITPREASLMDPRQRILLEAVWTAIEHAGESPYALKGKRVGVFIGATGDDFSRMSFKDRDTIEGHTLTGTSPSILANRISYVFDLKGPSEVVDTACSSSLVAFHRAVSAIAQGDCDAAIVGGVSLMLDHATSIALDRIGMLSADGKCKTFDADANGYARGEGVGIVYLKPLQHATRDRNRIYCRLLASAVNHGGRTASLTAPSPDAQRDVIRTCYRRAGVDPRTIGMIEVHGTGTALGDPIETRALVAAFEDLYGDYGLPSGISSPHCALTAVKTNIGHLEAASGIAGLIKTILALDNAIVPPLIGLNQVNKLLDIDGSPLFLCTKAIGWPVSAISNASRRAGVSSFGFGGANVHVLLESPVASAVVTTCSPVVEPEVDNRCVIVLSAIDEPALRRYAKSFVEFISHQIHMDSARRISLKEISYSLLMGRPSLATRLACVVDTLEGAHDALQAFLNRSPNPSGALYAPGHGNDTPTDGMSAMSRSSSARHPWLSELVRCWMDGQPVDWEKSMDFSAAEAFRLAPVPTYPFDETRYWPKHLEPDTDAHQIKRPDSGHGVFPLDEYADAIDAHRIAKQTIIPAAVFLAVFQGVFQRLTDRAWVRMRKVRFLSNIRAATAPVSIEFKWKHVAEEWHVTLCEAGSGIIYSSAFLSHPPQATALKALVPESEDARAQTVGVFEAEDCYDRLCDAGVTLGRRLRCIEQLRIADGWCRAELSDATPRRHNDGPVNPALLDGAMQAALIWQLETQAPVGLPSPHGIQTVTILGQLQSECLAVLSEVERKGDGRDTPRTINATLYDRDGRPCVQLEHLAAALHVARRGEPDLQTHFFTRSLRKLPGPVNVAEPGAASSRRAVVIGSVALGDALSRAGLPATSLRAQVQTSASGDDGHARNPAKPDALTNFLQEAGRDAVLITVIETSTAHWQDDVRRIFSTVRSIARLMPARPMRVIAPYRVTSTGQPVAQLGLALGALARTLRLENANIQLSALGVSVLGDQEHPLQDFAAAIVRVVETDPGLSELLFDSATGQLSAPSVSAVEPAADVFGSPFREHGVYLISGGLGGVGSAIAAQLLARFNARLIVCGRSLVGSPQVQEGTALLRQFGGEVHYLSADVSNRENALQLVETARSLYGALSGVIHCAGVLRDRLAAQLSDADVLETMAPKLSGALNLHHATKTDSLDFFVLCSSLVATTGNVGQSGYAFANGWLESFAVEREQWRRSGECAGKTVAICWGPWSIDGMRMSKGRQDRLSHRHGVLQFDADTGFAALKEALTFDQPIIITARGETRPLSTWVCGSMDRVFEAQLAPVAAAHPMSDHAAQVSASALAHAKESILSAIAAESGLARQHIDAGARFEDYGLDSALIVAVTDRLEDIFGDLPMTLFFEYRTLNEVATYLAKKYAMTLEQTGDARSIPLSHALDEREKPSVQPQNTRRPRQVTDSIKKIHAASGERDVAIIGMAGRLPCADDLTQFWQNLVEGRDCIQRIPRERWDRLQFGDDDYPGQWGGFINGWDRFDHSFFSVSATEAEMMDPQERLFLQCTYHALEDAGYPGAKLAGQPVGVYAGVMWGQYQLYGAASANTISSYGSIAHRVSHFFDFTGPSLALDTMCSSSLTALHLACESLRRGETRLAIVGGVNLDVHPNKHQFLVKRHFASSDGRCRAFGAGGNGYVPGEGVAALVLKPLHDALKDRDRIQGVIKGTAVNHGGRTRGYTVPNLSAQAAVVQSALRDGAVSAETISYVEMHGTGTALGDPIEVRALTQALGPDMPHCPIGSVKSNIGHLESAAGVASLIKVLLQMRHRILTPSIHANPPNEQIDFANSSFYVQADCDHWVPPFQREGRTIGIHPRRAGVSSFGAGGANAHVVLEEPPPRDRPHLRKIHDTHLVFLSARDKTRLAEHARSLLAWLQMERPNAKRPASINASQLKTTLIRRLGEVLDRPIASISPADSLSQLGLTESQSSDLLSSLAQALEIERVALPLSPASTIEEAAKAISEATERSSERFDLEDISYTSLVHREALGERLALVVRSTRELASKLAAYLDGQLESGTVSGSHRPAQATSQPADPSLILSQIDRRSLTALAELWCNGADGDWRALFRETIPRVTDQPGYPFAPTRCWVSTPGIPGLRDTDARNLRRAEYAVAVTAENTGARRAARLVSALTALNGGLQATYDLARLQISCRATSSTDFIIRISPSDDCRANIQIAAQNSAGAPELSAIVPQHRAAAGRMRSAPFSEDDDFSHDYEDVISGTLELRIRNTHDSIFATFQCAECRPVDYVTDLLAFVFESARRLSRIATLDTLTADVLIFRGTPISAGSLAITQQSDGTVNCVVASGSDPIVQIEGLRAFQDAARTVARTVRPSLSRISYELSYRLSDTDYVPLRDLSKSMPVMIGTAPDRAFQPSQMRVLKAAPNGGAADTQRGLYDPQDPGSLKACLSAIAGADTIVFVPPAGSATDQQIDTAVGSFCRLAEFLKKEQHKFQRLVMLTESGHAVAANESLNPPSALFLGLGRAAIRELPRIDVRLLDIAAGSMQEILTPDPFGIPIAGRAKEVILRNNALYERRIKRANQVSAYPLCYRDGGNYVLIGGSGSVGQSVSRYLSERHNANLAWIGRRNEAEVLKEMDLAHLPSGVAYHRADVCDGDALGAALGEIEDSWGKIDGVLHMGLDFDFRRLAEASAEEARRLLRAKVQGSRMLLEVLWTRRPDFVCFMSSAEVLAGNPGWGFYAGGCAFQDAVAQEASRDSPFPIRVINWGYWEGNKRGNPDTLAAKGITPLSVDVGMHALSAAVRQERPQLLVFDVTPEALDRMGFEGDGADGQRSRPSPRTSAAERPPSPPIVPETASPEQAPVSARRAVVSEPTAPLDAGNAAVVKVTRASGNANPNPDVLLAEPQMGKMLAEILATTLGLRSEDIDPDADVAEYGLDSILFLDFVEAVEKMFGHVPVEELIALDTLRAIAAYITSRKQAGPEITVDRSTASELKEPSSGDPLAAESDETASLIAAQPIAEPPDPAGHDAQDSGQPYGNDGGLALPSDEQAGDEDQDLILLAAAPASDIRSVLLDYPEQLSKGVSPSAFPLSKEVPEGCFKHHLVRLSAFATVEVLSCGQGPTLLLIPGIGLTAPVFHTQFEAFWPDWRVVAIHAPGHGRSSPPKRATTEALAESIEDALRLLAVERPVHVVASCFSTIVAQYLAARRPELVASLTLCGASSEGVAVPTIPPEGLSARDVAQLTEAASKSLVADFDALVRAPQNSNITGHIEESCRLLLASQKASPAVGMKYLNEVLSLRPSEWARDIAAPTLFVAGALDTVVPPEAALASAANFRNARVMEIANAGHYPFLTHPAAFNSGLASFLGSIGR